jgi:hypothetical protein
MSRARRSRCRVFFGPCSDRSISSPRAASPEAFAARRGSAFRRCLPLRGNRKDPDIFNPLDAKKPAVISARRQRDITAGKGSPAGQHPSVRSGLIPHQRSISRCSSRGSRRGRKRSSDSTARFNFIKFVASACTFECGAGALQGRCEVKERHPPSRLGNRLCPPAAISPATVWLQIGRDTPEVTGVDADPDHQRDGHRFGFELVPPPPSAG